jgi:proteasome lid subunit RPN8/RPN11
MSNLERFYASDGPERVGFILTDGQVIEVENVCHDPLNGFEVRPEDLIAHEDQISACWHTHPGCTANLSSDDYIAFQNYPHLHHYVIGQDGIRCFVVRDGSIIETDARHLPR